MSLFPTKKERMEKKAIEMLIVINRYFQEKSAGIKFIDKDVKQHLFSVKAKMDNASAAYGALKEKYSSNYDMSLEVTGDYCQLLSLVIKILYLSNSDGDFSKLYRVYKLSMLKIETIEKKFNILLEN